jgi:hypothetical protein
VHPAGTGAEGIPMTKIYYESDADLCARKDQRGQYTFSCF